MIAKKTRGDIIFDYFNNIIMLILCVITIYPFWYVLVNSFNKGSDAASGPIWLWPRVFTIENYLYVLSYPQMKTAFVITVLRCILGSVIHVTVCMMAAYAISKRYLPGRNIIIYFFMIPMFIGGTLVSNYLVIAKLGLLNNFLVYIIPGAFSFFDMIVMRTYIDQIPPDLEESATIDGANYWIMFTRIIIPLSKPIIAAFLFFGIVGGWLDLGTNLLYVTKKSLYTLQYILYMAMKSSEANNIVNITSSTGGMQWINNMNKGQLPTPEVIKMTIMVVVTFPILFIYPFFQKYFIKGLMIGSIKG